MGVRTRSASVTVTTPTASALRATRAILSSSARRANVSTTTTATTSSPALTSSVAILALVPAASSLSARFVTTDPSAVVPKVTQGTPSQLASVVLWSAQNSRDQKQNQGAS